MSARLSAQEIGAEAALLLGLGLVPPPGFGLREDPFDDASGPGRLVVPTDWHRAPPDRVVAQALREDLPLLHGVLREAYAGYDAAARRGWDWRRFFESWAATLHGEITPWTAARAFQPWAELMRLQPDRHTGPSLTGASFPRPATYLVPQASVGPTAVRTLEGGEIPLPQADAGLRPARVWWLDHPGGRPRTASRLRTPREWGALAAVRVDGAWQDVDPIHFESGARSASLRSLGLTEERPAFVVLAEDVALMRLTRVSPAAAGSSVPLPERLPEALRALIVDVRGHGGGDGGHWLPRLATWFGPSILEPLSQMTLETVESPVTPALHWGAAQALVARYGPPFSSETRQWLQLSLSQLSVAPATRRVARRAGGWRLREAGVSPVARAPRLIVLIDDECGSDGELIAALLASRPGAVLVGSGTAGAAGYGRPGRIVLPASRIPFQIATARFDLYGDARSVDGVGLVPDLMPAPSTVFDAAALRSLCETIESLSGTIPAP
jgi:hypothetical protein